MPDATITSTASTFGTISGVFSADQSTISGTISGIVPGTLTGSVGVPGPAGPGVPAGGTSGQFLQKTSGVDYATDWVTVNLTAYATESWVTAGFYPLTGNPSGFLTAAALTPYLTSATAASTYQTLAGMSSYLTTSTAASTYQTLSGMSDYLAKAGNLAGLANTGTARTNLGLGSLAVVNDAPSDGSQYARKNAAWNVVVPGDRYLTTSTTSNTVSNGNKTFTIGTGLSYTPTQNITISYDASNHMHGEVLTYNSGTGVLTVDINHHTGSGTYAAWVVNVGGVTPATSVAWGAITGTLSSQTDLQNALDLKLAATTAASTYQTLTGMSSYLTTSAAASTYQTQAAMSSYLTSSTAASTYATILEPSVDGILTVEPSGINTATVNVNQDANNYIHLRAGAGQISMVVGGSTRWFFNDTYLQFPGGTQQTVAYPGPSGFLLKADNLSGLANTGTARTNLGLGTMATATAADYSTTTVANGLYYPLSSNPAGYLTSAPVTSVAGRTGAITLAVADVSGAAPLASPTFTGTPSLPTGTIGVTQTAGNNTTALATTAFVTSAVPALATDSQARQGLSETVASAPYDVISAMMTPGYRPNLVWATTSSGTGASVGNAASAYQQIVGPNAGVAGYAIAYTTQFLGLSAGFSDTVLRFNKPIRLSGSLNNFSSSYPGDANNEMKIFIGNSPSGGLPPTNYADPSSPAIGWKKIGGASSVFQLMVHNGTTLTTVNSSVTLTNGISTDWEIRSDGAGNVQLYLNGTLAASTSAGPSGVQANIACVFQMVGQTASAAARLVLNATYTKLWAAPQN